MRVGSVRRAALAALVACSALLVAVAGAGEGAPATRVRDLGTLSRIAAQPANRAAVIVDTGDGSAPKRVCIRFDASSITGEEALRLAAAQDPSIDPVFSDFSGKGKAVCALCGVGCPSGDCFCDPSRYWAYHRAESGSSSFQASPVGVSSTEVTDGDVEGYRWGSGAAPAHADIRTVCGEVAAAPAPTTSPTTAAPPPSTTAPPAAPPPDPRGPGTTDGAPGGADGTAAPGPRDTTSPGTDAPDELDDATTTTDPAAEEDEGTTSTTGDEPDADDREEDEAEDDEAEDDDETASVRLRQEGETGGGGSGLAVAGVGATFAAMVAGAVALQRSRRRS